MNVGFVGLGKLGLPCALAIERFGEHQVWGSDVSPEVRSSIARRKIHYQEAGAQRLLESSRIPERMGSVRDVVEASELVFVTIQTPHEPHYEGVLPLPETRKDFDYGYLKTGVTEIARAATELGKRITMVIVSTVLPGTIEREILPLLAGIEGQFVDLCYNPYFIAMGTAIDDLLRPEFVLLGCNNSAVTGKLQAFYATLHDRPVFTSSVASAELIKVAYNTFIGMKIAFANTMMELCHRSAADVDDVTRALALATQRVLSPKYLRGGMGDGGGCHPRDNIALSWLARELGLSHDLFSDVMLAREHQTRFLLDLIAEEQHRLAGTCDGATPPTYLLGYSYKRGTSLTVGSPALLLWNMARQPGAPPLTDKYDPFVDPQAPRIFDRPALFFIGVDHPELDALHYPPGSTIIDPWGYIADRQNVRVVRVGRKDASRSS